MAALEEAAAAAFIRSRADCGSLALVLFEPLFSGKIGYGWSDGSKLILVALSARPPGQTTVTGFDVEVRLNAPSLQT